MKIGFFLNAWVVGGIEQVVLQLTKYFLAKNHSIYFFVFERTLEEKNMETEIFSKIHWVTLPKNEKAFEILQKYALDIYSFHHHYEPFLYQIADFLYEKEKKIVFSYHGSFFGMHDYVFEQKDFLQYRYKIWAKMNALTVLTDYDFQLYSGFLPHVIQMPNPNTFAQNIPKKIEQEKQQILAVGRLSEEKSFDRLVQVFALVNQKEKNWQLCIVGDGPERENLEKLAQKLTISQNVVFAGIQKNVSDFYQKSAIHVMSSFFEGFPMTLMEAKQHGIPSVVFDVPCFRELIDEGKNGFVVPQDDLEKMAEKILFLIQNPEKRHQMGQNAQENVAQYSLEKIGKRWEDLFESIVKGENIEEKFLLPKKWEDKAIIYSVIQKVEEMHQKKVFIEKEILQLKGLVQKKELDFLASSKILKIILLYLKIVFFAKEKGVGFVIKKIIHKFKK